MLPAVRTDDRRPEIVLLARPCASSSLLCIAHEGFKPDGVKTKDAIRSHASGGTEERFTILWYFRLSSPSQTHVFTS